ncbi:Hsp20/alpha crystallin family protein [Pontibacter cellulosilyticus]|uniref:Hsp20/alpha crystallin family protein n=1 Tax=Pontibacter cellulosilyticus TaxID=1720253 RepID=A0A923N740_9BACT|nr:Hsp20/alpha crystallin family protein [Pontibacter cellulosilyticus]MBC5992967.1 Hsp20/alpha crystallin family protein [Pontibacter cellulosilyticus]
MALNRYSGMQEGMPNSFSSMLDRFFNESVNSKNVSGFTPHVDACETEKSYEIEVALPGVRKENINIDFHEGRLTITGERSLEKKEEGRRYHMLETQYGSFSRTFYLPDKVSPDKISAHLEDGVLMVTVPKDEHKTMRRQINISSANDNKNKGSEGKASEGKGNVAVESGKSKK